MKTLIVPVSGGKDSQVVLSLALQEIKRTTQPLVCVHQNTGYDHPNTYAQIEAMEKFYGVVVEHTHNEFGGMFGFLEQAKYFPANGARGCTERLKQKPFLNWLQTKGFNKDNCEIWFGMRADESAARNNKYGARSASEQMMLSDVSPFYGSNKELRETVAFIPTFLPILDWTTEEVFEHIKEEGAPLNELYGKGHNRVGCYPCLLARKSEWVSAGADPVGQEHIKKLITFEDKWKAEGNPRKLIKVHPVWDVRKFLTDPSDQPELTQAQCGWCSI
jgi:3'-phosphoadenosine 5'-phosphosulfate sulfotransferase (PAPS reductase)/FAD synthetase